MKIQPLLDILSGFASNSKLNTNFTRIEEAFQNTLSRDGSSPNAMEADLDMNSNRVINLAQPVDNSDAATKAYVDDVVLEGVAAPTITIGTVTTGAPGTDAEVVNSGTPTNAVLDFTIPAGEFGGIENVGSSVLQGVPKYADLTGIALTSSNVTIDDSDNLEVPGTITSGGALVSLDGHHHTFSDITDTSNSLLAINTVTPAADTLAYFTGTSSADITDLTSFGRSLIAAADSSEAQSLLGVGSGAGDVVGPITSTTNAIPKFLDTSGDSLANSGLLIDASNNLTVPGTITSGAALVSVQGHTHVMADILDLSDNRVPYVNVKEFGAVFDGSTDDTAAIQAALDSGALVVQMPAGTAIVTYLQIPDYVHLQGTGMGRTILKRAPAAAQTTVLHASGKHHFTLSDFTVAGNKANCVNPATNVTIEADCWSFRVERLQLGDAKAVGGSYGGGLTVVNTADHTNDTSSVVIDCIAKNNDTYGLSAYRVQHFDFINCKSSGHTGYAGINIDDFTMPVPASPTNVNVGITNCRTWENGIGIEVFGFRSGSTALGDIPSQDNFVTRGLKIVGNECWDNTIYGIAVQADQVTITGNICRNNGSDTSNGNMLVNSRNFTCADNIVSHGYYFGIDGGGSRDGVFTGNTIANTGLVANQCIAVNLGACTNVVVDGNVFTTNGGTGVSGDAVNIFCSGYDGASATAWFPWRATGIKIVNNTFTLTDADHIAIKFRNAPRAVEVGNNTAYCEPGVSSMVKIYDFAVNTTNLIQYDNKAYDTPNGFAVPTLASANTVTIPDYGDIFEISGTTAITRIQTQSIIYWADKVRFISMTANGSGYTSVPSVTITGGGGSGAAGVACLGADGKIYGVYVTNPGSGYSSAPSVSITGGGGSGATATAVIGIDNAADRIITLRFQNAATMTSGAGNLYFTAGNYTPSTFNISSMTLRGANGNWCEVARG